MPRNFERALASAAIVALTAFGASAQDLTIAVQKAPDSLDPATENSNVNLRVMYSLFETLIKTDYRDGGKLTPGLAESWEVIDPRTIEFRLREGVVFHNGDTFDANDVAATFSPVRLGADENVPVATRPFLGGVDRVEVIDASTVRVHMKADDAIIANRFAAFPSQIISETALDEAASYEDFAAFPIGTGPYKLVSHEAGKDVVIEAFDAYWGENRAAAETVTFTTVPEGATRAAGLAAGQFDAITEVSPDAIAQIEAGADTAVVGGPIENIRGLFFDSTNEVLADPRIRQALNLAIDRAAIVEQFYEGRTSVPPGWQMDIFGAMYLEDRDTPEFDVAKAKALLAEAGYDGEEIVYKTQAYYANQIETAQILQSMWSQVGLNVRLQIEEGWTPVTEDVDDRHIIDASFTAYYPDPMGQFWRRFGPNSSYTTNGYWVIEPEMIALGEVLGSSIDVDERRRVFEEMLDKFALDPHGAILHTLAQFIGVRTDRIKLDTIPSEHLDLTTAGLTFVQ